MRADVENVKKNPASN